MERVYPDKERTLPEYGPSVSLLKAHCWKVRCPPKLKHFLWELVTGCITVKKNLRSRGIQGDMTCTRCGAPEESINHVFFESTDNSGLGAFKDPVKSIYFSLSFTFCKYGSFILESLSGNGRSQFCMDSIVYMERKEQ